MMGPSHPPQQAFLQECRRLTLGFVSWLIFLFVLAGFFYSQKSDPINAFDLILTLLLVLVPSILFHITLVQKLDVFIDKSFANEDALTGLPNRRAYEIRLHHEWNHLTLNQGTMSLLFIDIDEFKRFNSTHGHAMGDHVLKIVGKCIQSSVTRSTDFCSRWGGDEFVVLLPDTPIEGAVAIAHRILTMVSSSHVQMNGIICNPVSVSVGVSNLVCRVAAYPTQLERLADSALFNAKALGRNRVEICGV